MKVTTLTLLPLLVAASVPAERRAEHLKYGLSETEYINLAKRDFWDSVGNYLTTNLPGVIQWGANQLAWLMKWQESPIKFKQLTPSIDKKALKTTITYGPFLLKGTSVSES